MSQKKLQFNPEQTAVIEHEGSRSVAVLAGPGSGKTSTIVERVARHIRRGEGNRVLMLTFSRKAAHEMRDRLISKVWDGMPPSNNSLPEITTFHGFGWRLIRTYPEAFRIPQGDMPTILDQSEQKKLLRQIVSDSQQETDMAALMTLLERSASEGVAMIPKNKNTIIQYAINWFSGMQESLGMSVSDFAHASADILIEYRTAKRRMGVFDYGDLQSLPLHAMQDQSEVT